MACRRVTMTRRLQVLPLKVLFTGMAFLLSSGFVAPSALSQTENTFQDANLGISVSVPAGWTKEPGPFLSKSILVRFKRGHSFIELQGFLVGKTNFDLLEYARFQVANTRKLMGAKPVHEPEKVIVGNREAVVTLSQASILTFTMKILDYCFYDLTRKRLYHVRLGSPEATLQRDTPDFLSAVQSFTIQ